VLPQTQLGKTDIRVSRLGLGTVKFGRNQSVKYPQAFELPSDKHLRELLHCARDGGINLLDTAPAYGVSEERLGYLLRGERKEWIISTKAGEEFSIGGNPEGTSEFAFDATSIRKSIERSLRRLRTDYLDIVLIHSDGDDVSLIQHHQVLDTLASLKQAGWIRAIGMSTKTLEGGLLCTESADVVMTTFATESDDDLALLDACRARNTGVLLKKVFNSGHLLHELANNRNPHHIIEQEMARIYAQSAVNSAIIGTINCQHLRSNMQCALLGLAENSKLA
jgi:aryl-alcohol dehydrogenase-like predicted oxidoreductase